MTQSDPAYLALRARCGALRWPDRPDKQVFLKKDLRELDRAYAFAEKAHAQGPPRLSGEPYISHPLAVANLLLDLGLYDFDCLMAALLHDVAEDTAYSLEDIRAQFGEPIARMVDGLTKIRKMQFASSEQVQAQNVLKMLLALLQDFRVIVVKLADRLHNMRTLQYKDEENQRRIAKETMDVFVPIADMLGIRLYKEELEDIAIRYLDPIGYREIEAWLAEHREVRAAFLERIQQRLRTQLETHFKEIDPKRHRGLHIEGRIKSAHGIYRKHYEQRRDFDEIFDICAVRVIVDTEQDCWAVLGWVHQIYREIPGRYKNYISAPKQNGYQSIHLTMVGGEKIPFEVQIRTWAMHDIAEHGVAGHWKYKQGVEARDTGMEDRLTRIQELLDSYKDADSVEEVVQSIKTDIAPPEKVYPTTPKGETKELKLGATVLDFAYAVHTKVGHRFNGAKVNGRIVPIEYQVQTGDRVEILLSSNEEKGPSRDWKHIAVTSQAQTKIRAWFKKERREENIEAGRREVENELRRSFTRLTPKEWEDVLLKVLDRKHFEDDARERETRLDDFYAALGYGGLMLQSFLPLLREEYQKLIRQQQFDEVALKKITSDKGVIVEGIDNCQIKFARCCHPLPGDDIIGYITRGSVRGEDPHSSVFKAGGLTIHRAGCVNAPREPAHAPEPDRWLRARWYNTGGMEYLGALTVYSAERTRVTADIAALLRNLHIDISDFHSHGNADGTGTVYAVIGVNSREHLEQIRTRVFQIKGVTEVKGS